jgi:hypothetical protein
MHLSRASTFALLALELNRVMYLLKVYSENCIHVICVACLLLAQFMGVVMASVYINSWDMLYISEFSSIIQERKMD